MIRDDLDFTLNRYFTLNTHITNYFGVKPINSDVNDIKTQTDFIKNITVQKLKQLLPTKRSKRGILNPLGSIIKLVSGNLDNDDAIRYDALIHDVKSKQSAINQKVTVVAEMMKSLTSITNSTKYNFIQLDKAIWEIRKQLNDTNNTRDIFKVTNTYHLFLHNFQTLYTILDEIETIVAFSKLGTLHQSIVDSNELLLMLKNVEQQNKLMFPVNPENLLKLEQCIDLKVYAKESQITFIMDVPLVENDIYTYYRILPLPITNNLNQTHLILPKFPYLLAKRSKTVSLSHPCKEVEESLFLCEEDYSPTLIKDVCVANLVSFAADTTQCRPIAVDLEDVKVEKIQSNRWMLFTKPVLILTQNCRDDITYRHVQGTYIVTTDDDCEAVIGGMTMKRQRGSTRKMIFPAVPVINLPAVTPLKMASPPEPVNLKGMDLTNLQHLSNVLVRSESVMGQNSESVVNVRSISIGTLILYVLVILGLGFLYFIFNRNYRSHRNFPDNFELKEGGVMHPSDRTEAIRICA